MIPIRDGIRLHTEIYVPKKSSERLPFLVTRTPYRQSLDKEGMNRMLESYADLAQDGYIFVFQDNRGRYKSEGVAARSKESKDSRKSWTTASPNSKICKVAEHDAAACPDAVLWP